MPSEGADSTWLSVVGAGTAVGRVVMGTVCQRAGRRDLIELPRDMAGPR